MQWRPWARFVLVAVLGMPVAVITTAVMAPLWGRFEQVTGVESLGHSGPAAWCHVATWMVWLCLWRPWRLWHR